jgi:hypothetical protein
MMLIVVVQQALMVDYSDKSDAASHDSTERVADRPPERLAEVP